MGIFSSIMDKIFHHGQTAHPSPQPAPTGVVAPPATPASPTQATVPASTAPTAAPGQPVDVGAVLDEMASAKGGGGNYQSSIVDLLKLLDLDSSLEARKALANELNIHTAADGSAEENIALHKAVMEKLEENGGKVPDNLKGH